MLTHSCTQYIFAVVEKSFIATSSDSKIANILLPLVLTVAQHVLQLFHEKTQ